MAGLGAAALCTANHPPGFPGIAMWAETIASLGEQLIAEGWRRDDRENYSTVVHNDGTLGIAVASGTPDTGRANRQPTTRHAKGPSHTRQSRETRTYPLTIFRRIRTPQHRSGCCCTTGQTRSFDPSCRSPWRSTSQDTSRLGAHG